MMETAACCCAGREPSWPLHRPDRCSSVFCACASAMHDKGCKFYAPPCSGCGAFGCTGDCPENVASLLRRCLTELRPGVVREAVLEWLEDNRDEADE